MPVKGWASSYTKSKEERGYGHEWKKKRKVILLRDGYLCQPCKRQGVYTQATEVDHIVNKAIGGDDSDANLQSICSMCHKIKTNRERRGGVKKVKFNLT